MSVDRALPFSSSGARARCTKPSASGVCGAPRRAKQRHSGGVLLEGGAGGGRTKHPGAAAQVRSARAVGLHIVGGCSRAAFCSTWPFSFVAIGVVCVCVCESCFALCHTRGSAPAAFVQSMTCGRCSRRCSVFLQGWASAAAFRTSATSWERIEALALLLCGHVFGVPVGDPGPVVEAA